MAMNVPAVSFANADPIAGDVEAKKQAAGDPGEAYAGSAALGVLVGSDKSSTKDAPALSLVLCTYQRTTELAALFQSLAMQTFKDFEVIVVDQNPDDRISPYLRCAEQAGIALRHIKHGRPNLSVARNIGMQNARGEWIGFPDDDCWYEHDLLEQLSTCFVSTDALAGCAARWEELGEADSLPLNMTWNRSRNFRDRMLASFVLFFNRKLFDYIGNFDCRFGVGQWFGAGEETDLVLRALRAGATLTFHPAARVHHPLKKLNNPAEVRRRARGAGALYAKHGLPLWVVVRGLTAPVLRSFFSGAPRADWHISWMCVCGRWEGMMQWKAMRSRRHAVSNDHGPLGSRQQILPARTKMPSDG